MDAARWELVKRLFQAALDRPTAERPAFVQGACGSDAELRREIESLLAAHAEAGSFAEPPPAPGHDRLLPGQRFGPYEIRSFLAAGGMGEVYRAHDLQLRREVAIKILPAAVTADPERLARFEREARMLAALNHPHVGAIYGLEERHDLRALVLEMVEGPTLAERIGQNRLPVREALRIAQQIAEALQAAHAQGIIHRDLKPENVKVRPDGVVKVLDFGLAKLAPTSGLKPQPPAMTASPTLSGHATVAGTIAGTPAYMSPEQASGKDVDKQTDIWAFGCVLYEMLAGRRAFERADVATTLAAVLEHDPDWTALPSEVPPPIRALLRRCLEKDRARRVTDVAAAVFVLSEIADVAATEPAAAVPSRWAPAIAAVAAVAGAAALFGLPYFRNGPAVEGPPIRFEIPTPPTSDPYSLAISPDGKNVVFAATSNSRTRLWMRSLDSATSQPLAGTEGGGEPFWSPDSRAIGFISEAGVKRIDLLGGAPQVLVPMGTSDANTGGSWNRDGVLVFRSNLGTPASIDRLLPTGAPAVAVTRADARHTSHGRPQFLPDDRHLLYVAGGGTERGVYVAALDSQEDRRLIDADAAIYAPPGYLLFARGEALFAQRLDLKSVQLTGEPVRLAPRVLIKGSILAATASATGVLAYRAGSGGTDDQLAWFDRSGRIITRVDARAPTGVQLSHDGKQVAFSQLTDGNRDIWLADAARGVATRFTFDAADELTPIWAPDGTSVVFGSTRSSAGSNLYRRPASGVGADELLFASPLSQYPQDWSRDGRFLLFRAVDPKTERDLWALPLDGERRPFPVAHTEFDERDGQFSPDGRWIAYASNASGRYEIYVQPFPRAGARWQISSAGGHQPRWRSDGRELFYVAPDGTLMAAIAKPAPDGNALEAGNPVALFTPRIFNVNPVTNHEYAVSPDGQRFLVHVAADEAGTTPLTVVVNWTALLKE